MEIITVSEMLKEKTVLESEIADMINSFVIKHNVNIGNVEFFIIRQPGFGSNPEIKEAFTSISIK